MVSFGFFILDGHWQLKLLTESYIFLNYALESRVEIELCEC